MKFILFLFDVTSPTAKRFNHSLLSVFQKEKKKY